MLDAVLSFIGSVFGSAILPWCIVFFLLLTLIGSIEPWLFSEQNILGDLIELEDVVFTKDKDQDPKVWAKDIRARFSNVKRRASFELLGKRVAGN